MEIAVHDPWTGAEDFRFTNPTKAEIIACVSALRRHQPAWAARTLSERLGLLQRLAENMVAACDELLEALREDTGRIGIADMEFNCLLNCFDDLGTNAATGLRGESDIATMHDEIVGERLYQPYGVMLNITPWNFPLLLSFIDALPALVAGNAVVIKPSEVTPRWAEVVARVIADTDGICDVLAIVLGDGNVGSQLLEHVDVLSFTGSVKTGRAVFEKAAACFIPAYMELGGKDPAIVCADADLQTAAVTILMSGIAGTGQACQSLERIYVDESVHDEFVAVMIAVAQTIDINYPDKDEGFLGPFIFATQVDIVQAHIEDALAKGATCAHGGEIIDHGGKWLLPTILTSVTHEMLVMQEETFGPVLPVMPFKTEIEAIALANSTVYGLSASVFTSDESRATCIATQLHAGAVSINDASLTSRIHNVEHEAHGVSGTGRSRFGPTGVRRFTREKAILRNSSGTSVLAQPVRQGD